MNEYLTTLTTGALLALFALFATFFLFTPNNGHHKRSLYRMAALLNIILFLWNMLFVVAMLWFPYLTLDWQISVAFNLPLFPFITFVIKEMLYPDKQVGWKTILEHEGLPFVLMVVFFITYLVASAVSVWVLGLLIVWGILYLGIMLPLAVRHVRRYNALAQEIFVDAEGHSLAWLARLSAILFTCYLFYSIFSLFELSYLTTWLFNIMEFVVYLVFCLQISRMRNSDLIHIDEPEDEAAEPTAIPDAAKAEPTADPEAEKLIARMEQWLKSDNRLRSHDLNREMVAHAMHTNHATLAHTLREQKNMTLTQFVTDVRMREAERLLQETNLTVEEIYYQLGYQTRSTFSRAFQERNNCSATEWRETHQNKF